MASTDEKTSCTREIEVEIPGDVVHTETDSLVEKYRKIARIPGFRRGKVPASIIRQRFAGDLKNDVVENLVPRYLREATEKQGLKPVSQPKISDMQVTEGEALRFKATFEVMPSIEVSGYEGLRPELPPAAVTEGEVEAALNNVREQEATYTAVEGRPLQDGDFAQVAFSGTPEGSEEGAQPVKVDEVMVEIGGPSTIPEFTENLRGAGPGEERTFQVKYPDDFADHRLAGKRFTYTVSVKGVKQKNLPELNDDFAKQLGDFGDLAALRERIKASIQVEKEHQVEREAKNRIVEELVKRHDFPVPEAMVEAQIDLRLDRGLRALVAQGMRAEALKKMDFSRLRAGQRESAVKEVKVSLILDRIADLEHIEVNEEEVNKEIEVLALETKQTAEQARARLTHDGGLDRIRSRIRNEKTLDFLYRKSA